MKSFEEKRLFILERLKEYPLFNIEEASELHITDFSLFKGKGIDLGEGKDVRFKVPLNLNTIIGNDYIRTKPFLCVRLESSDDNIYPCFEVGKGPIYFDFNKIISFYSAVEDIIADIQNHDRPSVVDDTEDIGM